MNGVRLVRFWCVVMLGHVCFLFLSLQVDGVNVVRVSQANLRDPELGGALRLPLPAPCLPGIPDMILAV